MAWREVIEIYCT